MIRLMVMNGLLICLMLIWTSSASEPAKELRLGPQADTLTRTKDDPQISPENSKDYEFVPSISTQEKVMFQRKIHPNSHARNAKGIENDSNPQPLSSKSGGQRLLFSTEKLSWVDAQKDCKARGGALASLGDEPQDVFDYISANFRRDSFWLGGSDIKTEGTWLWLNGKTIDLTKNWRRNEPNNGGRNEDCMWLIRGEYLDRSCANEYQYICDLDSTDNIPFFERIQHLFFSEDRMFWEDAMKDCEAKQGTLAILENEPEDVFAHIETHYARIALWVGGSDIVKEGEWVWLNGNPVDLTKYWHRNEPNNWWGGEDCLEYDDGYNDRSCRRRNRYICDLAPPTTTAPTTTTTEDEICELRSHLSENLSFRALPGEQDCSVIWPPNAGVYCFGHPPLVLSGGGGDGENILPTSAEHSSYLTIACPGKGNHLKRKVFDEEKAIYMYCYNGIFHHIIGTNMEQYDLIRQLGCIKEIDSKVIDEETDCGPVNTNSNRYQIGFETYEGSFHELIQICFDSDDETTLWTKHKIHGKNILLKECSDRPGWEPLELFTPNMETIYKQKNQKSLFSVLNLKHSIHEGGSEIYLARGHLAARTDFVTDAEQKATFYYINAVPQWQVINNPISRGNWGQLEIFTRYLAYYHYESHLVIYNGGYGVLNINNKQVPPQPVPIYLGEIVSELGTVPIPAYTWKVVFSPQLNRAVAFVVKNDPFDTDDPIFIGTPRSRCGELNWLFMTASSLNTKRRGLTYCFSIQDFRTAFPNLVLEAFENAQTDFLFINLT